MPHCGDEGGLVEVRTPPGNRGGNRGRQFEIAGNLEGREGEYV